MTPYTADCSRDCILVLNPVPGANSWPRRLECETHGYPGEKRSNFASPSSDVDKPNDYVTEIASPADLVEQGDNIVSQY